MKKNKIVIIRGKSGAGKTTLSYELAKTLPHYAFIDIWKIKEIFEPYKLKNRELQNQIVKKTVYSIAKSVIKNKLMKNIILQESTRSKSLRKFGKDSKIYVFFLDVKLEDALKRNKTREKETMKKEHFIKQAKGGFPKPEKGDMVINTSETSIRKSIDLILKTIGEKRNRTKVKIRKCI